MLDGGRMEGGVSIPRRVVVGTQVSICTYASATNAILSWARSGGSYSTCHVNSHTVMMGARDPAHQRAMNACDLVTPDGAPIVKQLRRLGETIEDRVTGPILMMHVCRAAAAAAVPIGLYGSTQSTIDALRASLERDSPGIQIAYAYSPPFRPLAEQELAAEIDHIVASGARIVFVGLGCPKQELFVHEMKRRAVPGVFMAVGAAFEMNAGIAPYAPAWMQRNGLEWLFRLSRNPRRLWKRYAVFPALFIAAANKQRLLNMMRRDHG